MNMKKLMSSKKMLKWILFGAVVMASNGLMSGNQTNAPAATVLKAEDIITESNMIDQMKVLVYSQAKNQKMETGEKILTNKTSAIFTDTSNGTDYKDITEISGFKANDLFQQLTFIFRMELLPEILTKIITGEIKNAEIKDQGFQNLDTKGKIEQHLKEGSIKKIWDDFIPLVDSKTSNVFLIDELMAKGAKKYTLTNDLVTQLKTIEGKKVIKKTGTLTITDTNQIEDEASMKSFLNHFNKKFFDFLKGKDNKISDTLAITSDYLQAIGNNILKYQKIQKTGTEFVLQSEHATALADAAKAATAAGTPPANPAAVEFDITKATEKAQIEKMVSEETKKALETELKTIKDKKEALADPEKKRKEILEAALSLKMSSGMTTVGYPLIAASAGAVAGAVGTVLLRGQTTEKEVAPGAELGADEITQSQ